MVTIWHDDKSITNIATVENFEENLQNFVEQIYTSGTNPSSRMV